MKIIDTRDQRCLEGELVATLPAGEPVSDADMVRFYKTPRGAKNYDLIAAPIPYERLVLRRFDVHDDETGDEHYIVPRYPFYKMQE